MVGLVFVVLSMRILLLFFNRQFWWGTSQKTNPLAVHSIMPRSIDGMLQVGLLLAGNNVKQRSRPYDQLITWFKANYGAHPLVCSVLWQQLRSIDEERKLKYFYLCLPRLKDNNTEAQVKKIFEN